MIGASSVQDALNLVTLSIGPFLVSWSSILSDSVEDGEKTESDDGFLVDDVVFVGKSVESRSKGSGEDGGFGDEGGAWKGVED